VPFLLFYNNPALAIRASNIVSFVVLFLLGYQWGKHTGAAPGALGCCSPPCRRHHGFDRNPAGWIIGEIATSHLQKHEETTSL
jgi:hypothetical protein